MDKADFYNRAIDLIEKNNFEEAYDLLMWEYTKDPKNMLLSFQLGKLALRLGQPSCAYDWWGKSLKIEPANKEVLDCIAELDRICKVGKYKCIGSIVTFLLIITSVTWFQKDKNTSPGLPSPSIPAFYDRDQFNQNMPAIIKKEHKQNLPSSDENEAEKEQIEEEEEDTVEDKISSIYDGMTNIELYEQALDLFSQHKHTSAIEVLNRIKEVDLREDLKDNLYFWKGEIYFILKDNESAQKNYQKVVKLWPNGNKFIESSIKLALLYYKDSQYKESLGILKKIPPSAINGKIEKTYNFLKKQLKVE